MLVAGIFVIGLYSVRYSLLVNDFQKNVSDLPKAGARRHYLVQVSYLVHALVLIGQGVVLPAGLTEVITYTSSSAHAQTLERKQQQKHKHKCNSWCKC
jgi:hypothetical protein